MDMPGFSLNEGNQLTHFFTVYHCGPLPNDLRPGTGCWPLTYWEIWLKFQEFYLKSKQSLNLENMSLKFRYFQGFQASIQALISGKHQWRLFNNSKLHHLMKTVGLLLLASVLTVMSITVSVVPVYMKVVTHVSDLLTVSVWWPLKRAPFKRGSTGKSSDVGATELNSETPNKLAAELHYSALHASNHLCITGCLTVIHLSL